MTVTLGKGSEVSLAKEAPTLTKVRVGLGWYDPRERFDLDASVLMLTGRGRVPSDDWFIFYKQLVSPDRSVQHEGDNLTGSSEGDAEVVHVDLLAVSSMIQTIRFCVSIYEADLQQQNFGQVQDAYIRLVDEDSGRVVARFDLADAGSETGMVFGELFRASDGWRFRAVGQGDSRGLYGLAVDAGVNVSG